MESYGSLWNPMGSDGILLNSMEPYGIWYLGLKAITVLAPLLRHTVHVPTTTTMTSRRAGVAGVGQGRSRRGGGATVHEGRAGVWREDGGKHRPQSIRNANADLHINSGPSES